MPIAYNFRLYTYGAFDNDVLDDLRYAESLGAVRSNLVRYSKGRGYLYEPGPKIKNVEEQAYSFLANTSKAFNGS
jgi:hypothetical protein